MNPILQKNQFDPSGEGYLDMGGPTTPELQQFNLLHEWTGCEGNESEDFGASSLMTRALYAGSSMITQLDTVRSAMVLPLACGSSNFFGSGVVGFETEDYGLSGVIDGQHNWGVMPTTACAIDLSGSTPLEGSCLGSAQMDLWDFTIPISRMDNRTDVVMRFAASDLCGIRGFQRDEANVFDREARYVSAVLESLTPRWDKTHLNLVPVTTHEISDWILRRWMLAFDALANSPAPPDSCAYRLKKKWRALLPVWMREALSTASTRDKYVKRSRKAQTESNAETALSGVLVVRIHLHELIFARDVVPTMEYLFIDDIATATTRHGYARVLLVVPESPLFWASGTTTTIRQRPLARLRDPQPRRIIREEGSREWCNEIHKPFSSRDRGAWQFCAN